MANAQQTTTRANTAAKPAPQQQPERELVVRILQIDHGWHRAAFHGTRAQLEEEGIIPEASVWPDGKARLQWEDGRFSFTLNRVRPADLKGPMKLWLNGDWWELRWSPKDIPDHSTRAIRQKKAELVEELRRQSPLARRESSALWARYWKSREDAAFQAFKTLIPGLIPPKRGRKSATAS